MSGDHEFQEDEVLGKAYDARLMKRLLSYVGPYKKTVVICVLLLLATALLELAGPLLIKIAIDDYVTPGRANGLIWICLAYLGTLAAAFASDYLQIVLMNGMGQSIMLRLRREIFSHLQKLHLQYFDKNPVGRLLTRLTSDVDALNEMFTSGVVAIFGDLITLLGIMGILLALNWKLALVSFAVLPFLFWLSQWFRKNAREQYRAVRIRLARINAFLQESITGMSVIQFMNREPITRSEFDDRNRDYTDSFLKTILYYATFYPMVELLSSVALAGVIWIGGRELMNDALTLGALVAFIQYVRRFYQPIQDLSEKYNILQGAMASSERIFTLLDTQPKVRSPRDPGSPQDHLAGGEIEFKNVWFAYNHEEWVLEDVSFKVNRGEKVAFVGATGSGKTTLMNLLLRFYDVQRGEVLVDGIDVRLWPQKELRARMSLVLQDVFLFRGTIAENIRLDRVELTPEDVRRASSLVNADSFIERLGAGYDTQVGERGASLSTGQKQLLSFARAVARQPEVLILDEATSNVDTETEVLIQEALKKMMEGRTSLIVAHRLSTVRHVDRIIVLHKGRIVEQGTHRELLEAGGIYTRLYQLQYKDQEAVAASAPSRGVLE